MDLELMECRGSVKSGGLHHFFVAPDKIDTKCPICGAECDQISVTRELLIEVLRRIQQVEGEVEVLKSLPRASATKTTSGKRPEWMKKPRESWGDYFGRIW